MREQISFVNDGDKKYLVYEAGDNARRNNISLHMPVYHNIPQLLPMYPAEGKELKVNYDITGMTSLMAHFPKEAGRDDVFPFFQKLLFTLKTLRMDFMTEEDLLLKKEYIYIENQTSMVKLAATPDIGEGRSVAALFQDIIDTIQWKKEEEKSYLITLREALSRENITNEEIHEVLKKILSIPVEYLPPEPEPQPVVAEPKPEPQPVVTEPKPEPQPVAVEPEPQPIAVEPEPEPQPVAVEPEPEPQPVVTEAKPEPQPIAVEPEPEPQPVVTEAKPQPEPVAPEPPAIPQAYTSIPLDDDDNDSFGETTVLGVSSQPMIFPVLIRLKNNDRAVINKVEYLIGKDPARVDYCIFDNTAVSRIHAKIISRNGEFFVVDNHSTNHVYVNGILIDDNVEVRLTHGSHVRLGDEDFEFRFQ